MLDPEAPDGRRDEVAGETRERIESSGALKHVDTWGTRKLAFEIRRRTEADYRFYRFEAGTELLEQLDHSLKITDGVLRFRIFKVDPHTPVIAPPPTAQPAGVSQRAARAEAKRAAPPPPPEAGEEPAEEQPEPAEEQPEPGEEPAEGQPEPAEEQPEPAAEAEPEGAEPEPEAAEPEPEAAGPEPEAESGEADKPQAAG